MYLLQDFLRNHGTLEDLHTKYAISATRHKKYNNLVLLSYNQIESPFSEPLVREARGIILDEADNWRVVLKRFNKFGYHIDKYATPVNFATSRALVKEDGSIMSLYHYNDQWHVATSGMPDADGNVNTFPITFADLFWRIFNKMELRLPHDTNLCPSFEMMSPLNEVVVKHKNEKLVLIGLHDRVSGEELPLSTIDYYPIVKAFPFNSLIDIIAAVEAMNGFNEEGFVLTDFGNKREGDFCRVKIKSPDYRLKHHLKSSWSIRNGVEAVQRNKTAEVVSMLPPAIAEILLDIQHRYDKFVADNEAVYEELKNLPTHKEFAAAVLPRKGIIHGALFDLRRGWTPSIRQYISEMRSHYVVEALGLKDEENDK